MANAETASRDHFRFGPDETQDCLARFSLRPLRYGLLNGSNLGVDGLQILDDRLQRRPEFALTLQQLPEVRFVGGELLINLRPREVVGVEYRQSLSPAGHLNALESAWQVDWCGLNF